MSYELMEQFHWLPSQINKMSYREIQKIFVIRNQKSETQQNKIKTEQFKQSQQNMARGQGQTRRFTREV